MAILNHTWKFIFVHIPKTAGTSVAHMLEPMCTWRDLQLGGTRFGELTHKAYGPHFGLAKHSFASELKRVVGDEGWQRYVTFTVVRNPVERTISTYQYLRQHQAHYTFMKDINDFAGFIESDVWEQPGPDRIFQPQADWILRKTGSKSKLVDLLIPMEDMDRQIKNMLSSLKVPRVKLNGLKLPRKNRSAKQDDIVLTEDILQRIETRYAVDFQLTRYSVDQYREAISNAAE